MLIILFLSRACSTYKHRHGWNTRETKIFDRNSINFNEHARLEWKKIENFNNNS